MLASEIAEHSPGSGVVAKRLAEVLFIQSLRAHIGSANCKRGWLRAIFDPQIGAALRSIHENVNRAWTVESLAGAANMSRSAFAARFKELLGQTPLEYVTEWRMQKAVQLLKQKDKKLVEVAQSVGMNRMLLSAKRSNVLLASRQENTATMEVAQTCWIIRKRVVRARLGNIRIHFEVESDA